MSVNELNHSELIEIESCSSQLVCIRRYIFENKNLKKTKQPQRGLFLTTRRDPRGKNKNGTVKPGERGGGLSAEATGGLI